MGDRRSLESELARSGTDLIEFEQDRATTNVKKLTITGERQV
jgi:hypothetical protein